MSAFVVEKSHINAMIQAGLAAGRQYNSNLHWHHKGEWKELTHNNADAIGQMLLDENIKGVSCRYSDSDITDLPGRNDADYLLPFSHSPLSKVPKPIEAIKITNCYSYQTCELDEWETSEARAFCKALVSETTSMLPGYEEAPWEWVEELPQTKPIRLT